MEPITNRQGERMNRAITKMLIQAIDLIVAEGKLGKRSNFAPMVGLTENVFNKVANQLTPLTIDEWWEWSLRIKELSKFTYTWLIRQTFMDWNIEIEFKGNE